jgi:hypothetical protein
MESTTTNRLHILNMKKFAPAMFIKETIGLSKFKRSARNLICFTLSSPEMYSVRLPLIVKHQLQNHVDFQYRFTANQYQRARHQSSSQNTIQSLLKYKCVILNGFKSVTKRFF